MLPQIVEKTTFPGQDPAFSCFGLFPLDKFKYMKLHLVCFRKRNIRKIVNILPVIFGC